MRVFAGPSEVVDAEGALWLRPQRVGTRWRHALASMVLAMLILGGAATATLLPYAAAVPATAAVAAGCVLLVRRTTLAGASRIGLTASGVTVLDGLRSVEVVWSAVESLRGEPLLGNRVRIVIEAQELSRRTRSAFDREAARLWLERATAEAQRRRLDPEPAANGLGFITGPSSWAGHHKP